MADVSPGVVFMIILFAVPLQLYMSPKSTSELKYHLQRATDGLISFTRKYGIILPGTEDRILKEEITPEDELINLGSKELEKVKKKYYGLSHKTRERPPTVQFKIGDVIKHKLYGFRGVIIGWDERAFAPEDWLKKAHGTNKENLLRPHYAVIVDTRDRLTPQLGYIIQDDIELTTGSVYHPLIKHYFEFFDQQKQRYSPKPWLREVYPDDRF